MLGFGLGKLLILVLVVLGVWYGFKFVSRLDEKRKKRLEQESEKESQVSGEMIECPVCKTFVVAKSAKDCGKKGCPY